MAYTPDHFRSRFKITHYDFDPDSANKVDVAWVDFKFITRAIFSFFRTIGTGNLDTFRVIANDQADGSGTDVEIIAHALPSGEPNAVGDYCFVEVTAEQVAHACEAAGIAGRYVSLQLEFATNTDEGVATYILESANPGKNLTTDNIAA